MSSSTYYIGLMSGTSLDCIDCVLIDINERNIKLVHAYQGPLPDNTRQEILALNSPQANELARTMELSRQLGYLFADAVKTLLKQANMSASDVVAIGSHGQTLRHQPEGRLGFSLQIGDPSTITEETGIPVVADFRSRDVAASGQGAPLVPLFHAACFNQSTTKRAIVNIGGMANITTLSGDTLLLGFDSGPGNTLLDYWSHLHQNKPFDDKGSWSRQGRIIPDLLNAMLSDPYFSKAPPKSTGRDYFNAKWLTSFNCDQHKPVDVMATLTELTAVSIAQGIDTHTQEIYICGGGVHNQFLGERIEKHSLKKVRSTEVLGINPDYLEAMAFAWLAYRRIKQLPGNAPVATGAQHERILGAIYQ